MRLVLGLGLLATALAIVGCTGGSDFPDNANDDSSSRSPHGGPERPKTCGEKPTSTRPASAPDTAAIDGNGPIEGDGQVEGIVPASYGAECSDGPPSADAGGAAPVADEGSGESVSGGGNGTIEPGTMTAGVWDDNRNFDPFLSYRARVSQTETGLLPLSLEEVQAAKAALAPPTTKQKLDVSLVIDTTGSMGDELAYLNREFTALASTIEASFPNSEQHWSLVLYKDVSDEYVVRWFDFLADTNEFRTKLGAQSAGGGGDYEEAADRALDVGTRLSWREDANVAKLMFWVADAPHHVGTEDRLANAIRTAKKRGIHIYPVASSGIDERTELTMRSSAQFTGGRYVFLTDDSGVGGSHKEPSIPCYFVTKLDKAILRMVDIELRGVYREPDSADVLRTGGDPENGACKLPSGGEVVIY